MKNKEKSSGENTTDGLAHYSMPSIIELKEGSTGNISLIINGYKTKHHAGGSGYDKWGKVLADFINEQQGTTIDGRRGLNYTTRELNKQGYSLESMPSDNKNIVIYKLNSLETKCLGGFVAGAAVGGAAVDLLSKDSKIKKVAKKFDEGGKIIGRENVIVIKPHHAHRDEYNSLIAYLEDNSWSYKTEKAPNYELPYIIVSIVNVSKEEISEFKSWLENTSWDYTYKKSMADGGSIIDESPKDIWDMYLSDFLELKLF